jgi:sensor histidine kinase YesM
VNDKIISGAPGARIGSSSLGYWALQLLGWGFYFYAQASGEVIFASVPWSEAGTLWGIVSVAGIGLTHLLRGVIRRQGWLALPPVAILSRIIAATLIISTASFLLTLALSQAIHGTPVAPITSAFYLKLTLSGQLRNQYIIMLMVHGGWLAIYLAFAMQRRRYHAELRQAQLGEALQAAELRLLKSQLNPHYLFNALNGLRSLIADDPGRAREAVTQLARTLRYTLASGEEDLVSLERELEMVDDYLSLEKLRLADRLHVEREIALAARTVRIPAMLLQTLVENAIKHGIAALKQGGTLRITAQVVDEALILRVTNPRPTDAADMASEGVGLRNSSERLRLLFGSRANLSLDLSQAGQAIAEVRLPP